MTFRGCGPSLTTINITTNRDLAIKVIGHSAKVNVNGQGVDQPTVGETGSNGPGIYVCGASSGSIISRGGTGGPGFDNSGGEGDGGSGGTGGIGGVIKLVNCIGMAEARSQAGIGGDGGLGGSGGTTGGTGADGSKGNLYLLHTSVQTAECAELYYGCSNVEDVTLVSSIPGDFGGNANMTIPIP